MTGFLEEQAKKQRVCCNDDDETPQ